MSKFFDNIAKVDENLRSDVPGSPADHRCGGWIYQKYLSSLTKSRGLIKAKGEWMMITV